MHTLKRFINHTGMIYQSILKYTDFYYRRAQCNTSAYGITYGFSQGVLFLAFVITFGFGAYQVTRQPGHIAYESFRDVFTVFIAIIFGAFGTGQASSFAPNYAKAKQSANRIFALLDREPVIDGYSEEGLKPVSG